MPKYFILLFSSVTVAAVAQIILKSAAKTQHKNIFAEYLNLKVVFAYGLMFVSMFLNIFALKGISYKYSPVASTLGFALVLFLSALIFKEKLTKKRLIGALLIIFGIIIFYLGA